MKKLSPNAPCPCGNGYKYKKCCLPYHRGKRPPDALTLMKSRYSAYAAGEADYILRITHPENVEYEVDRKSWRASVLRFCLETEFLGLEILVVQGGEEEVFVTFLARLSSGELLERSRFLKDSGEWLYHSAIFPS
ncbi:YchJ family protein [Nitratifractor sp.]